MAKNRKNQIVEVAARLFSGDGYEKVTVKKIATECGITEAAIYKHYDSKMAIYSSVLESIKDEVPTDRLFKNLDNELEIEPILRGMAEHIIKSYKKHQKVLRLLLYSSLEKHSLCDEVYTAIRLPYVLFLKSKLESLIATGKVRDVDPMITARCFVGMVFDCCLNICLWTGVNGRKFDMDKTIGNNIPIYVQGLKRNDK